MLRESVIHLTLVKDMAQSVEMCLRITVVLNGIDVCGTYCTRSIPCFNHAVFEWRRVKGFCADRGAGKGNGKALLHQRSRFLSFLSSDQVDGAQLIVLTPSPPIRERLHHFCNVVASERGAAGKRSG